MKQQLHITARPPLQPKACIAKFRANQGYGSIELTPYGDYILNTAYITEASARRTNEYKNAYKKVTMEMLHSYEAETCAYTCIHRNMPSVESVTKLKNELMTLAPQKYKRGRFDLRKPIIDDIEIDLIEEAKNINFDKTNTDNHIDEKKFVKEHISEMVELRQQAWQEACDFFNKIEDAREERENSKFFAEYKTLYNSKQEYLEGKEDTVKQALITLCKNISVPYNLSLSFFYSQPTHTLDATIVLEDGISIPLSKATILSSGKISIKNKLVKETITEKTNGTISLIYYLASHLFNISPNVQYLRISLYDKNKLNPLLWVEFERNKFSRKNSKTIDVVSDILGYPNVLDFKNKVDAIELCTMNLSTFDSNVAEASQRANAEHSEYQSTYIELGDSQIAISFDDANMLCTIPNIANDIRRAISMAKDRGQSYVAVDKKHKSILDELKKKW